MLKKNRLLELPVFFVGIWKSGFPQMPGTCIVLSLQALSK